MRIVLCGFRGTGKTECGRLRSKLIGLPFLDTDAMIEERTGVTIHEFFSRDGEKSFREQERQVSPPCHKVTLNVVINGTGTVWVDDIVLSKESL